MKTTSFGGPMSRLNPKDRSRLILTDKFRDFLEPLMERAGTRGVSIFVTFEEEEK